MTYQKLNAAWLENEPRPVHNGGPFGLERLEQDPVIVGGVLEVGVLDQDDLTAGVGQAGPDGRALSGVGLVAKGTNPIPVDAALHHLPRVVTRPVVDQNDLEVLWHLENGVDHVLERLPLVICRDQYGEIRSFHVYPPSPRPDYRQ